MKIKLEQTLLFLAIIFMGIFSISAQSLKIEDLAYASGGNISVGGTIEIEVGKRANLNLFLSGSKPNGRVTVRFLRAVSLGARTQQIGGDLILLAGTSNIGTSAGVDLSANDFNNDKGVFYAEMITSSGIKYQSNVYSVEVIGNSSSVSSGGSLVEFKCNDLTLGGNSISGYQSVARGSIPRPIQGSVPKTTCERVLYKWYASETLNGEFKEITKSRFDLQNYRPGPVTKNMTYYREASIFVWSKNRSEGGHWAYSKSNKVTIKVASILPIEPGGNKIYIPNGITTVYKNGFAPTINGNLPEGDRGDVYYQWQKRTTGNWENFGDEGVLGSYKSIYPPLGLGTFSSFFDVITAKTQYRRILEYGGKFSYSNIITINYNNSLQPKIMNNTISGDQIIPPNGGRKADVIVGSLPENVFGRISYSWSYKKGTDDWKQLKDSEGNAVASKNYDPGLVYETTKYQRIVTGDLAGGQKLNKSNVVTIMVDNNLELPVVVHPNPAQRSDAKLFFETNFSRRTNIVITVSGSNLYGNSNTIEVYNGSINSGKQTISWVITEEMRGFQFNSFKVIDKETGINKSGLISIYNF